jgi:hypothetical protein
MKRYFDMAKDRLTLEIDVDQAGALYTIEQIEKTLKITGLREIGKKEYNKLSKEYTK